MEFASDRQTDDEKYLRALAAMNISVPAHLRSKFDPVDVVQDALLRAHQNAKALEGRSVDEREAYLRKCFASAVTDRIRHFDTQAHRVALECSIERTLEESSAGLAQVLAATQTSPSQNAVKAEELLRLASALACLPERQREAVSLHHLESLTLEETSLRMNVTKEAVIGLLRRGMEKLREKLCDRRDPDSARIDASGASRLQGRIVTSPPRSRNTSQP